MALILLSLLVLASFSANVPQDTIINCKPTLSNAWCVDQARKANLPLACEYRCNCADTRSSAGIQCRCQSGAPACRISADCWDETIPGTNPAGWCKVDADCPQTTAAGATYCNTLTRRCAAIGHFDYCYQHRCLPTVLCTASATACNADQICVDSIEFAGQKVCVTNPLFLKPPPKACYSASNCVVGKAECKCRQGGRSCTCKEQSDAGPFFCDALHTVRCPTDPAAPAFCPNELKCNAYPPKCPLTTCTDGNCPADVKALVESTCGTSTCNTATGLCAPLDGTVCTRSTFTGKCSDGWCL